MRKTLLLIFIVMILLMMPIITMVTYANEYEKPESSELYAKSAVLIDGDTGRVLYGKNQTEVLPMASTTKIMTCIIALENGDLNDRVTVTKNAASKPKVHLGMQPSEEFYLKDLLYSLMLESHNDSAVAIAEHIGGTEEGFASIMNDKAQELGLSNSYFITANGLDACDQKGTHATTAEELALIMRYCIMESPQKEKFIEITKTPSYGFANVAGTRSFSCNNHNAFLGMMEGALSGKTGFTGDAGYCYVGALERDGRTFIVALLACGWPNNKSYKWSDMKHLMNYAIEEYNYKNILQIPAINDVAVKNGIPDSGNLEEEKVVTPFVDIKENELMVLLGKEEKVEMSCEIPKELLAPVKEGDVIGRVSYSLEGREIKEYNIRVKETVEKISWEWCFKKIIAHFMCGVKINQ